MGDAFQFLDTVLKILEPIGKWISGKVGSSKKPEDPKKFKDAAEKAQKTKDTSDLEDIFNRKWGE